MVVREIFSTLQGEGSQAGRPAVFVRLSGCNLWSGIAAKREASRGVCGDWCDTDFASGSKYDVDQLVDAVRREVDGWGGRPLVVVTGGEPALQLRRPDGEAFVLALVGAGLDVAIETNGTVDADVLTDDRIHVTVSPKRLRVVDGDGPLGHVVVRRGVDLKVVHPQWTVDDLVAMTEWSFAHRFVQPRDDGDHGRRPARLDECVDLAKRLGWRLGVQTHKWLGLP